MTSLLLHDGRVLRTTASVVMVRDRLAAGGRVVLPVAIGYVFVDADRVVRVGEPRQALAA